MVDFGGDYLFVQGHVSPGIYARAYLEGRLSEEQLLQSNMWISKLFNYSKYELSKV